MFLLLGWMIYGLIVGLIAKKLHHEEDMIGFLPTIGIGVAGSFIGGFIAWLIGCGHYPLAPSGLLFGILGALLFLTAYHFYRLNRFVKTQGRVPKFRIK